jgi:glycosyltransferase involved in cell wall biosynthesis
MIKFSIVIPCLNQIEFLKQCLENILHQSYKNFEVIIIDGGSNDGTKALIKKYSKKYSKFIFWKSEKDNGQADAINKGMKKSSGNWIAWQNCDDYYKNKNVLKIFHENIKNNPSKNLFIGNINLVNKSKKIIREIKYVTPSLYSLVYEGMTLTNQAAFWSSYVHKDIGYLFNSRINFDYEWFMRILSKYPKGAHHINQILGCYRLHENQKTYNQTEKDHQMKLFFKKKYGFNQRFCFLKIFLLKFRRFSLYILQGNLFYALRGVFYLLLKKN